MTSVAGRLTAPTAYTYCVSKYGAESFSDRLRAYCQQFGIKVSIMEPSFLRHLSLTPKELGTSYKKGMTDYQKK